MTDVELAQALALGRCTFSPGSTTKRFAAWAADMARRNPQRPMTEKGAALLDKLAHQYREQLGRCMSAACTKCAPTIDLSEVAIAADAVQLGDARFDEKLVPWRKAALRLYNAANGTRFSHPYEYATKVAAENRRAETLGDIFCRFCGERLFSQIKRPHQLVKSSAFAQHHLTVCALQTLAGTRPAERPGHRALPMEDLWR